MFGLRKQALDCPHPHAVRGAARVSLLADVSNLVSKDTEVNAFADECGGYSCLNVQAYSWDSAIAWSPQM